MWDVVGAFFIIIGCLAGVSLIGAGIVRLCDWIEFRQQCRRSPFYR
jgi:hypothetical protein